MANNFDYTFDDEIVCKFSYDSINNRIEIYFLRYFDVTTNEYIETTCCWVIENWKKAYSKLSADDKYNDLEKNLGVFSLILIVDMKEDNLSITASTLDNRYIDLMFEKPKIGFFKNIQLSGSFT